MDKNKLLNKDFQEANKAVSNNTISDLCIQLENLERKLQMVLDQQMRAFRDNNKLLSKELNKATNNSNLQSKQLRMNVTDKLGLSNPKRVKTCEVDKKGEVVLPVNLFDGDTIIITQKF